MPERWSTDSEENGVYDALQRKFLHSVILSISLDSANDNNVHECYTFSFSYADGNVPTLLVQDSKRGMSTSALPLDSARRSMSQLFRQLIIMTQSLSPLPANIDRLLSIRLFFTDATPEDYQPPGFRPSELSESARFVTRHENDRPHDQEIGSLNTGFHACTLRITAIGDLEQDSNQVPSIKIWDAEHNAKSTCEKTDDGVPIIKTHLQIPPPFEANAVCPVRPEHDQMETSQATQILTQVETIPVIPVARSPMSVISASQVSNRRSSRHASRVDRMDVDGESVSRNHTMATKRDHPHSSQADLIACECGDTTDEGIMMQCEACQNWFHCSCYGFKESPEDGYLHTCYSCKNPSIEDLERFKSLVIMRRSLYILWDNGYCFSSVKAFGKAIGIADLRTTNGILQRLLKEGWLQACKKKGKAKSPAYEVIKSQANERRLHDVYFNPQQSREMTIDPPRLGSFVPASMMNSATLPPPPTHDSTEDEDLSRPKRKASHPTSRRKKMKVSIIDKSITVPDYTTLA